jgi:hypothetical protein
MPVFFVFISRSGRLQNEQSFFRVIAENKFWLYFSPFDGFNPKGASERFSDNAPGTDGNVAFQGACTHNLFFASAGPATIGPG